MPPIGKSPKMARLGKKNPKWKDGRSSDFQRRIKKAKRGELVHHKDGNRSHNTPSNLQVLKPRNGITAIGVHNKKHNRHTGTLKKK